MDRVPCWLPVSLHADANAPGRGRPAAVLGSGGGCASAAPAWGHAPQLHRIGSECCRHAGLGPCWLSAAALGGHGLRPRLWAAAVLSHVLWRCMATAGSVVWSRAACHSPSGAFRAGEAGVRVVGSGHYVSVLQQPA